MALRTRNGGSQTPDYWLKLAQNTQELSEIEKLKIENRILKAQSKQQQMEIDFLKKLDEIERR